MVRDFMTRAVKTVRIDANVRDAVKKMNKFNIGSIVVVDGKRPVGIITERDILRRIVEEGTDPSMIEVKQIMPHPTVTIQPDASIEEAAKLMAKKRIKKLPVVENDKLVGIITTMDLTRASPKIVSLMEELLRIRHSS